MKKICHPAGRWTWNGGRAKTMLTEEELGLAKRIWKGLQEDVLNSSYPNHTHMNDDEVERYIARVLAASGLLDEPPAGY